MRLGCMLEMKCEFDKAGTALASSHGLKALNPLEKSRLFFFFFFFHKGGKKIDFFPLHWHRMKFFQQLPGDNGLKLNSPISLSNYRTFYFFKLLNTKRIIIRQALGIHTQATWDMKVHTHGRAPFIVCY